jgi:hypothetical protein
MELLEKFARHVCRCLVRLATPHALPWRDDVFKVCARADDRDVAASFKNYFDILWEIAMP